MELFVSDKMMFEEDSGIQSMAYSTLHNILSRNHILFESIWNTICAMSNKLPIDLKGKNKFDFLAYCEYDIKKVLNTGNVYLFCAYPNIESLILHEHKGSTLLGKRVTVTNAVMQVSKEPNGVRWYISDRPLEDNTLRHITIDNKGSGYFTYFGPDAPNGSDYYIDQFKEW